MIGNMLNGYLLNVHQSSTLLVYLSNLLNGTSITCFISIGAPSNAILDAPSTSMDHPFLRAYAPQVDAINAGRPTDGKK